MSNIRVTRSTQTLVGGSTNDSLYNSGYMRATMAGGAGKDTIRNFGNYSYLSGGSGHDSIINSSSNTTINGDTGNDVISISSSSRNVQINYYTGEGNDKIYGFDSNDVFNIASGTIRSSRKSGSNLFLTIGSGTVTLMGVGNKTLDIRQTLRATRSKSSITGSAYNDHIFSNGYSSVTMSGGNGNDTLSSSNTNRNKMIGGAGNDEIFAYRSSRNTVDAGAGNDSIYASVDADYSSISGGAGNDLVYVYDGDHSTIIGGAGNDTIHNNYTWSSNITGGNGNDVVSLSSNSKYVTVSYASGDGNDKIYGFDSNDVFEVTSGKISSSVKSGSNLVLTIGSGKVTLMGVGNKTLDIRQTLRATRSRSSVAGSVYNDFIYALGYSSVTMNGGNGNDSLSSFNGTRNRLLAGNGNDNVVIVNSSRNTVDAGAGNDSIHASVNARYSSISGGAGNDVVFVYDGDRSTITGGAGNDTIYNNYSWNTSIAGGKGNDIVSLSSDSRNVTIGYANGDGNDKIYGFGSDDVFNITSGTNYSSVRSGSSMILTIGSGRVTLVGSSSSQTFNVRRTSSSRNVLGDTSYFDEDSSVSNVDESSNSTLWGNENGSTDYNSLAPSDSDVTISNGNSTDVVDITRTTFDDISRNFSSEGIIVSTSDNSSLNLIGSETASFNLPESYQHKKLL